MTAESAAQIYQDFEPATYRAPHLRFVDPIEAERPQTELESLITRFDQNWREERLPRDWYNLKKKVGFSMDLQMNLLVDESPEALDEWTSRARLDVSRFTQEYLVRGSIHPYKWEMREGPSGVYLYDPRYKKAMVDTVSPKERNGSVVRALSVIENAIVNDGKKVTVMPSPQGRTGLRADNGKEIEYPENYWFVDEVVGSEVFGYAIRTDFSLAESREAIKRLTGRELAPDAPLEDYVSAVALISPEQGINSATDVVDILRDVRRSFGRPYAYKTRGWEEVYDGLEKGEELYEMGKETDRIIVEMGEHLPVEGLSRIDRQKIIAATILRLSKLYLVDDSDEYEIAHREENVIWPKRFQIDEPTYYGNYGQALDEVEKIPGCAGGGQAESVASIVDRLGIAGSGLGIKLPEDKYGSREVECPSCGKISIRPKDKLIPQCFHCGSNKVAC